MRIVLDEDLPRILCQSFQDAGHDATHIEELGWKGVKNGELLRRVSGRFDVLVTGDSNMPYQQRIDAFDIALVQLRPRLKVVGQLLALVPAVLLALPDARPGTVTTVEPHGTEVDLA